MATAAGSRSSHLVQPVTPAAWLDVGSKVGFAVLGPLPRMYRIIVVAAAVLLFVGAGALAAYTLPYPILVSAGASVGLAVGAIAAYLLVHPHESAAQPARPRRRRLD